MKMEYGNREFVFEITKEDLKNIPPEKLAQIMINGIENALFKELEETMLRELFING